VGNDVNTLNGQLVRVGEKNEYRLSHKKFNVSANPFGFLFEYYALSGSIALSRNIALRGEFTYLQGDNNTSALGLGAGLPNYFGKVYSGLFLEPGISMFSTNNKTVFAGPQLLMGYHWYWDSNINVAIAAGLGRNLSKNREYRAETFPAGYFQIGYAFGD